MPAPTRSLEQRLTALEEANRIRSARAVLKRRIRADRSRRTLELVIRGDERALELAPGTIATMHVFTALIAAPAIGRVKANRIIRDAHVSPSKTIAGLTTRQREDLIERVHRAATPTTGGVR